MKNANKIKNICALHKYTSIVERDNEAYIIF